MDAPWGEDSTGWATVLRKARAAGLKTNLEMVSTDRDEGRPLRPLLPAVSRSPDRQRLRDRLRRRRSKRAKADAPTPARVAEALRRALGDGAAGTGGRAFSGRRDRGAARAARSLRSARWRCRRTTSRASTAPATPSRPACSTAGMRAGRWRKLCGSATPARPRRCARSPPRKASRPSPNALALAERYGFRPKPL